MKIRILASALLLLCSWQLKAQNDFITRWNLATAGSGATQITFNTTNASGSISYTWQEISPGSSSGSGSFTAGTAVARTITGLPANAMIELRVAASNLQRFYIDNGTDRSRLTDVTQWVTAAWTSMANMFRGCNNLNISATDIPNLSGVTDMGQMFLNCTTLNGPSNINSWNTANVTSMASMFQGATAFNKGGSASIGNCNTANMTAMNFAFNHSLGAWIIGTTVNRGNMISGSGINCDNYSSTLQGWAAVTYATARNLGTSAASFFANEQKLVIANRTTAGLGANRSGINSFVAVPAGGNPKQRLIPLTAKNLAFWLRQEESGCGKS